MDSGRCEDDAYDAEGLPYCFVRPQAAEPPRAQLRIAL